MIVRVLRHYLHVSVIALGAVEALILFATAYLAVTTGLGHPFHAAPEPQAFAPVFPKAFVFTVAMLCTIAAFGCYQHDAQRPNSSYYARCLGSFAAGAVVVMLVFQAIPALAVEHDALTIALLLGFVGHVTARAVFFKLLDMPTWKRRVFVLGAGNEAARVCELERRQSCTDRFKVVGCMPLDAPPYSVSPSLIVKQSESIDAIVRKHEVDEIVVALRDRRLGNMPLGDLLENKINGTTIIDWVTFFERETGRVKLDSVNPSWLIFSDGFRVGAGRNTVKRVFDVFISSALFLITLPIMIVTAILVALESPGPVFYRQQRVGQYGEVFELRKFRSMRQNAEPDGAARWAVQNDARCTAVGGIIRKLRIDELPQLINVLRGDMSFVGPRPERPSFVAELSGHMSYYSYRHTVKPGITGWAQVRYPYAASIEDTKTKLEYDLYYVKNHSLLLDLLILIRTIHIVLFAQGAR
jgi:sugar transferase (PEP-CTERM system associated)